MSPVLLQLRRYICWAAVGAFLFGFSILLVHLCEPYFNFSIIVVPWYADTQLHEFLQLASVIGGLSLVGYRAIVGLLSRQAPTVADRTAVILLGRFFVGWLLATLVIDLYLKFQHDPRRASWAFVDRRDEPTLLFLGCLVGSGAVLMLIGHLRVPQSSRLVRLVSGAVLFATVICWWAAVTP